jgi:hypothetical protein
MNTEIMPTPIFTIEGDEYVIHITPNKDGTSFSVTVHDCDTFEWIIPARRWRTYDQAVSYANSL